MTRNAEELGVDPDDIVGICNARAALADGRGRHDLERRWREVGERYEAAIKSGLAVAPTCLRTSAPVVGATTDPSR